MYCWLWWEPSMVDHVWSFLIAEVLGLSVLPNLDMGCIIPEYMMPILSAVATVQLWSLQGDYKPDVDQVVSLVTSRFIESSHISNDLSFRQKHQGVPDGSDGTSYPLTESYMLSVAEATGRIAHLPPLPCGDVYAPPERHVCCTLRSGCSYAEAIYTTPGDVYVFLRPPLLWECCWCTWKS